ncbi:hypothetical protein SSI_01698 [Enterococcus faecium EnGen0191]|nr:hypothetical protein SSI_01698 [Enterococcus faecium EnGen0191]
MVQGKFKKGDVILNRRWGALWEVVKVHPFHYIMKNLENDVIATFPILPVDGASRKLTEKEKGKWTQLS